MQQQDMGFLGLLLPQLGGLVKPTKAENKERDTALRLIESGSKQAMLGVLNSLEGLKYFVDAEIDKTMCDENHMMTQDSYTQWLEVNEVFKTLRSVTGSDESSAAMFEPFSRLAERVDILVNIERQKRPQQNIPTRFNLEALDNQHKGDREELWEEV